MFQKKLKSNETVNEKEYNFSIKLLDDINGYFKPTEYTFKLTMYYEA